MVEGPGDLRARLGDGRIHLLDGAMGTVLYERGVFVNVCYDELNLSRPDLVEGIHREYVEAGSRILETNTFGANPVKLSSFGLEARTVEINRAAVERAREGAAAARLPAGERCSDVLVLGALGPLGIRIEPWGPTAEEEARGYFARQVEGLLEGGVDGFVLETFQDVRELGQALRAVKERSDLPVMTQVTIEGGGRTSYGTGVEEAVRLLEEWGADAVGVNCSVGPAEILDALERMTAVSSVPLSALPNAGLPRTVGDRKIYMASPEYMARYARRMAEVGARFIGGCCGTTPDHIRAMGEALEGLEEAPVRRAPPSPVRIRSGTPRPPEPLGERSPLGRRLAEGQFTTAVELVPPLGWDPGTLLGEARRARLAGVDLVSIPDAPRARARMAALPAAILVQRETGLDVLAHYACRDRNMLGMISDLLGAAAAGVRNLLAVTGDLPPTGPYGDRASTLDIDSIGLTNVLHHLNRGVDPGGSPVEVPTPFVVGVGLNHGATDLDREHRRFRWKVEAGAEFAVTQPVFAPDTLLRFLDQAFDQVGTEIPILAGIWPLDSLRTAEFLHHEVPGIQVPGEVMERMREAEARGPEAAWEEGIELAVTAASALIPRIRGIHVAAPREGVERALEVVRRVRARMAAPVEVGG